MSARPETLQSIVPYSYCELPNHAPALAIDRHDGGDVPLTPRVKPGAGSNSVPSGRSPSPQPSPIKGEGVLRQAQDALARDRREEWRGKDGSNWAGKAIALGGVAVSLPLHSPA